MAFVQRFVLAGERAAALELNKIVSVVGSGVSLSRIIERVEARFGVIKRLDDDNLARRVEADRVEKLEALRKVVVESQDYVASTALVRTCGYDVREVEECSYSAPKVWMAKQGLQQLFASAVVFVRWAAKQFAAPASPA